MKFSQLCYTRSAVVVGWFSKVLIMVYSTWTG